MVDELKPIDKSWLIDRVRLGERYLRYNLDEITNEKHFNSLRDIKIALDQKESSGKKPGTEKTEEKDGCCGGGKK